MIFLVQSTFFPPRNHQHSLSHFTNRSSRADTVRNCALLRRRLTVQLRKGSTGTCTRQLGIASWRETPRFVGWVWKWIFHRRSTNESALVKVSQDCEEKRLKNSQHFALWQSNKKSDICTRRTTGQDAHDHHREGGKQSIVQHFTYHFSDFSQLIPNPAFPWLFTFLDLVGIEQLSKSEKWREFFASLMCWTVEGSSTSMLHMKCDMWLDSISHFSLSITVPHPTISKWRRTEWKKKTIYVSMSARPVSGGCSRCSCS